MFFSACSSKIHNIMIYFSIHYNCRWDLKKWVDKRERLKNLCVEINKAFCGNSITINHPGEAKCFEVYLLSFAPLYRIFFVVCSILALGTHGYFYCGCSLYLFLKSSVLHQVLTAVRRSGKHDKYCMITIVFTVHFQCQSLILLFPLYSPTTYHCWSSCDGRASDLRSYIILYSPQLL